MRRIASVMAVLAASVALIAQSQAVPLVFVVKKPLPFGLLLNVQFDMTGWTALTQGATKGGAEVVTTSAGQSFLLVRANDDGLYAASVNAANPSGPLATSAWSLIRSGIAGEADCAASVLTPTAFICATLEPGGSAAVLDINASASGLVVDDHYNLGGANAGTRPSLLPMAYETRDAATVKADVVPRVKLMVWDGNAGLFIRAQHATVFHGNPLVPMGGNPHLQNATTDAWVRSDLPFFSAPACKPTGSGLISLVSCVWRTANNQLLLTRQTWTWQDPPDKGVWKPLMSWPSLAGGNSGTPELVVLKSGRLAAVVRGADGHIKQAIYDPNTEKFIGTWKDEGGFAQAGSSISCAAAGEQPVCTIQGGDGRIWFKKLSAASGL